MVYSSCIPGLQSRAGITAPIFKQNTIRALWNDAKSQQRIALLGYHETVLKAYEEY